MSAAEMTDAFARLTLNVFTAKETTTSKNAILVETAANSTSTKNTTPKIFPPAISSNTAGSVWNIRLGPLSGENPNANTAGRMANPAIMATMVSKNAMLAALLGIF